MVTVKQTHPLREFRDSKGLTQLEMARNVGVSLSMYEKVERGYMKASRNFMEKVKNKYPYINIESIFFNN